MDPQINSENELFKNSEVQLPASLEHYIESLPEPEQKTVKALFIAMSIKQSSFTSPIPPPDILKLYNDIIPNAAERVFKITVVRQNC